MIKELTYDDLHKRFKYFPDSGILIDKENDSLIGKINYAGYLNVFLNGRLYGVHRIVYFMYYGYMPKGQIDHINRIRNDNRIENLREVFASENAKNRGNGKTNKSGIIGIRWLGHVKRWKVYITFKGKLIHIGNFKFFINAAKARLYAENIFNYTQHTIESPAAKFLKSINFAKFLDGESNSVSSEWRFFCLDRKKILDQLANS